MAASRIRAVDGFSTGVRTIAARAGVSPGLITHHFGSKSALRAACDEEVSRRYFTLKSEAITHPNATLLQVISTPSGSASITVYLLRAVLAGGQLASDFLDRLTDDMRAVMAESVATGVVRPSRDEEARLCYLTYQALGALIVRFVTTPHTSPEEFVASLRTRGSDAVLPMLELYTEGPADRRFDARGLPRGHAEHPDPRGGRGSYWWVGCSADACGGRVVSPAGPAQGWSFGGCAGDSRRQRAGRAPRRPRPDQTGWRGIVGGGEAVNFTHVA